jgi:hypothetical protein
MVLQKMTVMQHIQRFFGIAIEIPQSIVKI